MAVLTDRLASIEASTDMRFASVASEDAVVRNDVMTLSRSAALSDSCEVLITGIPATFMRSELIALASQVPDTHPWSPGAGPAGVPPAAPSTSSVVQPLN